jgi:hypothetical protein
MSNSKIDYTPEEILATLQGQQVSEQDLKTSKRNSTSWKR